MSILAEKRRRLRYNRQLITALLAHGCEINQRTCDSSHVIAQVIAALVSKRQTTHTISRETDRSRRRVQQLLRHLMKIGMVHRIETRQWQQRHCSYALTPHGAKRLDRIRCAANALRNQVARQGTHSFTGDNTDDK